MAAEIAARIDRRLRRTEDALETEFERTHTEARAFRDFARIVRDLDFGHSGTVASGPTAQTVTVNAPGTRKRLREAYEDTVMAVPHYEAEYGDTFEESFPAEFGAPLSSAILQGPSLSDRQTQLLLAKVRESRQERLQLVEVLETERDSVRTHAERLRALAREMELLQEESASAATFGDYDGIRSRLLAIESECEDRIERRQETLTDQRTDLSLPIEGPDVPAFVYDGLETTYPILASIADVTSAITSLRSRVERGMAYAN